MNNELSPDNSTNRELDSKYDPHKVEKKWYPLWEKNGLFSWKNQNNNRSKQTSKDPKSNNFSIVIPPPNVTGSLHLGHALNHTIQDILIRYNRMKGKLSLWVPGTDHAGIATQNVVEKILARENTNRWELGRENFEKRVWQWKAESGGMITHQQRELGESVDWNYERFTMDEGLSIVVKKVFVKLYKDGLIYQGERIINWCPHCVTALSNIEVEYRDRSSKLYFIKYPIIENSDHADNYDAAIKNGAYIIIATTRPETMLGDEAVAVHPDDIRYQSIIGKNVLLPLLNRPLPVIADTFVEQSFGSGAVKITPAHDPNDFLVGERHNLRINRIMDDYGKINSAGGKFQNLSREKAREQIVKELEEKGLLEKIEEIKNATGECYRCQTVVEPIASQQWFVKVKPLADKSIEVVKDGSIEFIPKRWENTYFEWMYNIQDWCISRQLWWGHRIPAYYCSDCKTLHVEEEEPSKCKKCGSAKIYQDQDVLDTWFSSALWPFSTLLSESECKNVNNWPAKSPDLDMFYPTSVLVTGFDIIFFWVARMIMMGTYFMNEVPFKKVYIHGLVRDAERKKMSKSKGNVVNPLEKMEEYGTDAFRFFLMSILPEGKDIIYDESRLKGYSAFCNKIWNTARYIWMNQPSDYKFSSEKPAKFSPIDEWLINQFNITLAQCNESIENMRFADYSNILYNFIWKNFCDNYVEMSKPLLKMPESESSTRWTLNYIFVQTLKLLHPAMPFITEHLYNFWHNNDDFIIISPWPEPVTLNDETGNDVTEKMINVVYKIRYLRSELGIAPGEKISAFLYTKNNNLKIFLTKFQPVIITLARLSNLQIIENESSLIGLKSHFNEGMLSLDILDQINIENEKNRLGKEEKNLAAYIETLNIKLSREDFTTKAPAELINSEREKKEQAMEKLKSVKEILGYLG